MRRPYAIAGRAFSVLLALLLAVPAAGVSAQSQSSAPAGGDDPLSILKSLTDKAVGGGSGPDFLHPDEAFRVIAEVDGGNALTARWQIADGYYLYRKRMSFGVAEESGVVLGEPVLPEGKLKNDEYFGEMEVYYYDVAAQLPVVQRADGEQRLSFDVTYQGCADAGLCYPPITKTFELTLPAALDAGPVTGGAGGDAVADLPEQDRLARSLMTGNTALVLLSFFGLGLLLTFTPCVFPMIPILSSIIVGQGENISTRRAFSLSLIYVLAMAATYTAAGVVAGLFGANLQAAFQNPWILSTFAIVFVLLSLSMFGFYDLQIPASWQARLAGMSNRQEGGTYFGVGVMGFLSALIVGPCVAAPLAGALIYIGQTGDALLGGTALFALAMGMGAPVLAIGTSAGRSRMCCAVMRARRRRTRSAKRSRRWRRCASRTPRRAITPIRSSSQAECANASSSRLRSPAIRSF